MPRPLRMTLVIAVVAVLGAGCAPAAEHHDPELITSSVPAVATRSAAAVAARPTASTTRAVPHTTASTPAADARPPTSQATSHPPPLPPTCAARALRASWRDTTYRVPPKSMPSSDWTFATDFDLTNTSGPTCILSGWVGFTMLGDTTSCTGPVGSCHVIPHDRMIPQHVVDDPGSSPSVLLQPGNTTSFSAIWVGTLCLERPYEVRLTLPGTKSVITTLPIVDSSLCAKQPVHITALGRTVD